MMNTSVMRIEGVRPRRRTKASDKHRLSGGFTTQEDLSTHLGPEVTVLKIGTAIAWAGLLTDINLHGYFLFTRIEIRGVKRYYGVRMKDVRTTTRFAKNEEEWYKKRHGNRVRYLPEYQVKWHGTPYLESPVSKRGEDLWLLQRLAHMPAALPAITDGMHHEFNIRRDGPVFLHDAWPIIEEQWKSVVSVMTTIGLIFQDKLTPI